MKNLLKLIAGLVVIAAVAAGAYLLTQVENPKNKYSHPISRPGASW